MPATLVSMAVSVKMVEIITSVTAKVAGKDSTVKLVNDSIFSFYSLNSILVKFSK